MKKNKTSTILLICFGLCFILFVPYAIRYISNENSNSLANVQFDNLEDLEVIGSNRPIQERDLEKYPLASMYYQHMTQKALQAIHSLRTNCNKVADKINNVQCEIPDVKEFERILEKVNNDYHGDFKKVLDLLRGSIVADNLVTLRLAINEFNNYYKIAQTKNRFKNPLDSGYRDFVEIFYDEKLKIYGEMQFHLCHLFDFKKQAHEFYEKIRSIQGKAKLEQRELSNQEKEEIEILVQKSKKGYEQAFFENLNGKECQY
jgi:hypothetical protein